MLPNDAPPWLYDENTVNLIGTAFLTIITITLIGVLCMAGYILLVPTHRNQLKLKNSGKKSAPQ